jgi:transposase
MNLHLAAISAEVAPSKHAALLVDQAGWHVSKRLVVPPNMTIVRLPAKCPELNPQENVWQYLRENWLSNLVFAGLQDIVDHCCRAWSRLAEQTRADPVNRTAQLGPPVLTRESWY